MNKYDRAYKATDQHLRNAIVAIKFAREDQAVAFFQRALMAFHEALEDAPQRPQEPARDHSLEELAWEALKYFQTRRRA